MQLFEFSKFNQDQRLPEREEVQMKPLLLMRPVRCDATLMGKLPFPAILIAALLPQEFLVCIVRRCSPLNSHPTHTPANPHGMRCLQEPFHSPPLSDKTHNAGCPQSGGDRDHHTHAGNSGSPRVSLGFQASCASANIAIPAVDSIGTLTSDQRWVSMLNS